MEFEVYGLDGCGYYKRVVKTIAEVDKIVATGTVEQIVKTVKIEHQWSGSYRTNYRIPSNWKDDSDYSAFCQRVVK